MTFVSSSWRYNVTSNVHTKNTSIKKIFSVKVFSLPHGDHSFLVWKFKLKAVITI